MARDRDMGLPPFIGGACATRGRGRDRPRRNAPGPWPVVGRVDYADDAILRGRAEFADPGKDVSGYRVLIASPGGARRWDSCDTGDKTIIVAGELRVVHDPQTC